MKLQRAIEILTNYMKGSDEAKPVDFDDATKLGIEALKRIHQCRFPPYGRLEDTLPGETEE